MDELELLKQHWQQEEQDLPKLSYQEIQKMIWKKSTSVVRWILIISLIELILPHLIYLLPSAQSGFEIYSQLGISQWLLGFNIVYYAIALYFIYLFYKRYKDISVLDDSQKLMNNILETRNTVKYYVIFSLSGALIVILMVMAGIYTTPDLLELFPRNLEEDGLTLGQYKQVLMLAVGIGGFAILSLMAIIYFLIYGFLIRKLRRNHQELRRIEV